MMEAYVSIEFISNILSKELNNTEKENLRSRGFQIPCFKNILYRLFLHEEIKRILYLTFAILIISENTPAAVTLAPAPYPFIIIGYSLYRSVVI